MIFWRFAAILISVTLWFDAIPARADVNEFQIDWMISQNDLATATPEKPGRNLRFNFRLLPSKLYVSEDDIASDDGTKLLPAGSQLYLMTGSNFAVCSQAAAGQPFVGASKRICLRDDDGDGYLDTYWLRTPLQQLLGKGEWLIMNSDIPAVRGHVVRPRLRTESPDLAEKPAELSLWFSLGGNGRVDGAISVRNGGNFSGGCVPMRTAVEHSSVQFCLLRDLITRGINFDSPNKDERRLEVEFPKRDVKVRFSVSKGILMGININSIYLQ